MPEIEELTCRKANHEAGGRRRGYPALDVALRGGDGPTEPRERDDAGRALERLEPSHDLRLLGSEPLGRKRLFRFGQCVVVDSVEPGGEGCVLRPALRAGVEVCVGHGLPAGGRGAPQVGELIVIQMTARSASTKK